MHTHSNARARTIMCTHTIMHTCTSTVTYPRSVTYPRYPHTLPTLPTLPAPAHTQINANICERALTLAHTRSRSLSLTHTRPHTMRTHACENACLHANTRYVRQVHLHRAVHKTKEKIIMIIALLGYYCIHPALQLVKRVFCAMSLLGNMGSCMAFDRLVEYINLRQAQRNSSFRAFDSALHYTERMLPMMHVDAAYTAAISGNDPGGDVGYDPRLIREVEELVKWFTEKAGTDLTQPNPGNPFWHTGHHANMAMGSARQCRPSQWLWDVAIGRAAGISANAQSCAAWVQGILTSMFPY